MKKVVMMIVGAGLLMSSCGSYTATGAYTGGQFGHVIGSAVGGIGGGWRGHEVGSIVGTIGGVAAGAAIGSAIERGQQRKYEKGQQQQSTVTRNNRNRGDYDQSGYDQGGYYDPQGRGDDRIDFMGQGFASSGIEIRNIEIIESRRDGVLTRGEELTVVFEVMNHGDHAVRNLTPLVEEATGNKHIHISPAKVIGSIDAHRGVRYTAHLIADRGLRRGQIVVRIGVAEGRRVVDSQIYEYQVPTDKGQRIR